MTQNTRFVEISRSDNEVITLKVKSFLAPPVLAWKLIVTQTYIIRSDGTVEIATHILPVGGFPPTLPRMGLSAKLPGQLATVTWAGLGPGESYRDKKTAQKVGVYTRTVEDMHTRYEVPQENGNRTDTRWVTMSEASGIGLAVKRVDDLRMQDDPTRWDRTDVQTFDFAAHQYDVDDLDKAQHPIELRGEMACSSGLMQRITVWGLEVVDLLFKLSISCGLARWSSRF